MATKEEWKEYFETVNGRQPTIDEFTAAMKSGEIEKKTPVESQPQNETESTAEPKVQAEIESPVESEIQAEPESPMELELQTEAKSEPSESKIVSQADWEAAYIEKNGYQPSTGEVAEAKKEGKFDSNEPAKKPNHDEWVAAFVARYGRHPDSNETSRAILNGDFENSLTASNPQNFTSSGEGSYQSSLADQLTKLHAQVEDGTLTQFEYERVKQNLLAESNRAANTPISTGQDNPSFGWSVLGFFIPLVGLILWLVWKNEKPQQSRNARNGFITGTIVWVICWIIYFIVIAAAVNNLSSSLQSAESSYNQSSSYSSYSTYSSSSDTYQSSSSSDSYDSSILYPTTSMDFTVTDGSGYAQTITVSIGQWVKGNDKNLNSYWHALDNDSKQTSGKNMPDSLYGLNGSGTLDLSNCIVAFGEISTSNATTNFSGSSFNGGQGMNLNFNVVSSGNSSLGIDSSKYNLFSGINWSNGLYSSSGSNGNLNFGPNSTDGTYTEAFVIVIPDAITPNSPTGNISLSDGSTAQPGNLALTLSGNDGFTVSGQQSVTIGQNW